MRCPFCNQSNDRVVDSRESGNGHTIRRRRECLDCGRRYTSYERVEEIPFMVVKRDGSRTEFDRKKLLIGLYKACEKRPVPAKRIDEIVDAGCDEYEMKPINFDRLLSKIDVLISKAN